MTEAATQGGGEPWPSLETASWWFDRASFALIASLVIGVVATVLIVWMGTVKEHHWDLLREQAAKKIADLGLETAKAKTETALAQERIAELNKETARLSADAEASRAMIADANARALEAKAELAKFKAPRSLTDGQQSSIRGKILTFAGTKFDLFSAQEKEALTLLDVIEDILLSAGWEEVPPASGTSITRNGRPPVGLIIDNAVSIQFSVDKQVEFANISGSLAQALAAEGIEAHSQTSPPSMPYLKNDVIHIVVGSKPQ